MTKPTGKSNHFSQERSDNIVAICVVLQTVIAVISILIQLCE